MAMTSIRPITLPFPDPSDPSDPYHKLPPLEDCGDRVVIPALTLPPSGDLHRIQAPRNGGNAHPFGVHLLDGGDGAQLALVVYDFAADPSLAIG